MTDQTSPQQAISREITNGQYWSEKSCSSILAFEQGYGWRFTGFRIPLVLNPVRAPLPLPAPPILPISQILANIGIRRALASFVAAVATLSVVIFAAFSLGLLLPG
ncbi:hypothetical protein DID88_003977 [Monilinia fructigena]|uniref:Uncharacterized protein n=1 Tax=Monilinia fructigena TaxID=38457 RepID=A0A395IJG3_9HELO|nr:hypothetical protein DID88_003977 [Monilinia fructigena]